MTSKLGPVAKAGDELFIINLQDGQSIKSSGLRRGRQTRHPPAQSQGVQTGGPLPRKSRHGLSFQALNGSLHIPGAPYSGTIPITCGRNSAW
ncbi:MAG: hypothetical protein ACLT8E_00060 [Akkermansia sp.]